MIGGRVLDASTIVGFAQELPYPQALVWTAVQEDMVLAVPAAALATAWARTPAGEQQDALRVLLELPNTVVEPLDATAARQVGMLLAGSDTDAIRAGQVAVSAVGRGWAVVTGEPEPLRAVDPRVEIDELP